ncbi:MAG: hemolysin family protein [Chloroflexota bacterium]
MTKLFLLLGLPGTALFALAAAAEGEGLPSPTTLIIPFIVIIILVLINGYFVAAEFAIIGVRPTQMEALAEQGDRTAGSVLKTLESRGGQDRYIATAQLGITVASLGLGMYAEPQIAHFIEPYIAQWFTVSETVLALIGYVIGIGIVTYLHVVIGEMVPKALALSDASNVVRWLNRSMQIVQWIMTYPVKILNGIGNSLLRLFRVPPAEGHERVLSPEEIELIVLESAEEGLLYQEEEEIIRNIFDFSERTVEQVMTPRTKVQTIPHTMPRADLLKLVSESRHSRFPVYEGDKDHIIGILHVKDLMRQTIRSKGSFDLRLILRTAPAVPEDLAVQTLLAAFKRQRLHMALVLDEFGGLAGVVTLEDLVEEIVGEVRDEFDLEKEPFVILGPGVVEVEGEYLVDALKEKIYLGEDEALPDVETVGGLIITKLGRPPRVGDVVTYNDNVHLKVLAVDRRAVARVTIDYPDPAKVDDEDNHEPTDDG